jgi:prevent-host-death family protein
MNQINIHEAKTRLSQLIDAVETGAETEITIARNGRPVARLMPLAAKPEAARDVSKRIGVAKGKFIAPETIDRDNAAIEKLFYGVLD